VAAFGVALVLVTGRAYWLPTRPEWRHWSTLTGGLATALLLGPLTALLAGFVSAAAGWLIVAGVTLALAGQATWMVHLSRVAPSAWRRMMRSPWTWVRPSVGVYLPLAVGLMAIAGVPVAQGFAAGALCAAVAGETTYRALFFDAGLDRLPLF